MRGERWIPCSLLLLTFLPFLLAIEDPLIDANKDYSGVEHRVKRNSGVHPKSTYSGSHSSNTYSSSAGSYSGSYPSNTYSPSAGSYSGSYPSNTYSSSAGSYSGFPGTSYAQPPASPVAYPYPIPFPYYPPSGNEHYHEHEHDHGHGHCDCTHHPLPPCTAANEDPTPAEDGPLCECNQDHHPQGCTPKLCEAGIIFDLLPLYVCICLGVNPHNEPPNCIKLLNTGPAGVNGGSNNGANNNGANNNGANNSPGLGHTSILGLADLTGINPGAKDQLGAGLAGTKVLSDKENSQLYLDLLSSAAGAIGGSTKGASNSVGSHSSAGLGHTDVLGLADLTGINPDAKDQLGAGLAGTDVLSDQANSQLYVDLLSSAAAGATKGSPLKSSSSDLLSLLGGNAKKGGGLLGLTKRKKRAAITNGLLDLNKGLDVTVDKKKSAILKLAPVQKAKIVKRRALGEGGGEAGGNGLGEGEGDGLKP